VLQVPERSREAFRTLCILRGYLPNLLARLAEDGWIPAREHINWDLESDLKGTNLVESPNGSPLYRFEPLIRQLVALQMEYSRGDRFSSLNLAAAEIFEEQVMGEDRAGQETPNRSSDRMQVAFAVEALYHQAVLLRLDDAHKDSAKSKLLGK